MNKINQNYVDYIECFHGFICYLIDLSIYMMRCIRESPFCCHGPGWVPSVCVLPTGMPGALPTDLDIDAV